MRAWITLLLSIAALVQVALASVTAFYPIAVSLGPVQPVHVLLDPGTPGVTVDLGASNTSARVVVVAGNQLQLLKNPDFYSDPNYWYCSPGAYLSCYWLSSDTGASGGVVELGGAMPADGSSDFVALYQPVTIPATASQVVISARLRLVAARFISIYRYYVGLYDPDTGYLYGTSGYTLSYTYTTVSANLTGLVQPGKTYYAVVALNATSLSFFWPSTIQATITVNVDSVYLYVTTSSYTFSGAILEINGSSTAYGRLVLANADAQGDLSANITLANTTAVAPGQITVSGGNVISSETGWIPLGPPPPGYTSGSILLDTIKGTATNSTLLMDLEICYGGPGQGACVHYPVELVIDPPGCHAPKARVLRMHIALKKEPVSIIPRIAQNTERR